MAGELTAPPSGEEPSMTSKSYGQFCGVAKAFEIIGAPWSALIIRDLILEPKSLADLRETLPSATPVILGERLRELADAGVVHRTTRDAEPVYELTAYGRDLEPILLALGGWGARSLGFPRQGDLFSLDMAILALRGSFRPDHARGVRASFELRFGPIVINAKVDDGVLMVTEGELPDADMTIETPVLLNLMAGELTPTDALWLGLIDAKGDPSRLNTFVQVFHLQPAPDLPPTALPKERTAS
jgi:DNA-binding HxlR family transcriptional regulator